MGKLEWLACNYEEVAKELQSNTSPKLEASQQQQILKTEMEKCKLVSELSGENVVVEKSPTRKVVIEPTYNPNATKYTMPNTITIEETGKFWWDTRTQEVIDPKLIK